MRRKRKNTIRAILLPFVPEQLIKIKLVINSIIQIVYKDYQ